jgi:hypothetical protein
MTTGAHIAFDTLKFVETLIMAGMPAAQAKALSVAQKGVFEEVLDNTLATKGDILALKTDIAGLRAETKADIVHVEKRIDRLEVDIKYIKWISGVVLAGMGTLIFKAFF